MRKPNQKQQSINNFFADTSADLFQSISDEQAETVQGGYVRWSYGDHTGDSNSNFLDHYCFKTYQIKQSYFSK